MLSVIKLNETILLKKLFPIFSYKKTFLCLVRLLLKHCSISGIFNHKLRHIYDFINTFQMRVIFDRESVNDYWKIVKFSLEISISNPVKNICPLSSTKSYEKIVIGRL